MTDAPRTNGFEKPGTAVENIYELLETQHDPEPNSVSNNFNISKSLRRQGLSPEKGAELAPRVRHRAQPFVAYGGKSRAPASAPVDTPKGPPKEWANLTRRFVLPKGKRPNPAVALRPGRFRETISAPTAPALPASPQLAHRYDLAAEANLTPRELAHSDRPYEPHGAILMNPINPINPIKPNPN